MPEQLAVLARALRLAGATDSAEVAVARLLGALRGRDRWLLVFDNAEDPPAVARLLPGGSGGRVLVTSRNPDWHGVAVPIEIQVFSRPESVRLLGTRRPDLGRTEAERIAAAVGDLPLAIDQAAALLADTGLAATEYLALLDRRPEEVYAHELGGAYPVSVAAGWAAAFDLLAEHTAAQQLLALLGWLGPEPVPRTLVTQHPDVLPEPLATAVADPLAFASLTRLLHRRGLARIGANSLHLHRVPATLLRARTETDLLHCDGWPAIAVRLLAAAAPTAVWNNPPVWSTWRALLPHVLAATSSDRPLGNVAQQLSCLLDTTAAYLQTRGEPGQALLLLQKAHALDCARLGDDDPTTLISVNNLANAYLAVGDYRTARELHQDTYDRRRRVLGEDAPATSRSAVNLATALAGLGDYEQARVLQQGTFERRRRLLGARHLATLNSASNLATTLVHLGEFEQARVLHQEMLDCYQDALGSDHPDTLRSADNLATSLAQLGHHEKARLLHQETHGRRTRVLGENHPDTLRTADNLAMALSRLGRHEEALTLHRDTFEKYRRVLGRDHPDSLRSADNLATTLVRAGDYEQAQTLQRDTLDRRRRVLGEDHPDTHRSVENLAITRARLG